MTTGPLAWDARKRREVLDAIAARHRFVVTSHTRPDGDAVGSTLACAQLLHALGKHADVVLHDGVPFIYRCLPLADAVRQTGAVNGDYDAAVILECDSVERTRVAGLESLFGINIDHHRSGKPFAQVNWIEPGACATAEMIYWLARDAGANISPAMASCLYTAVLTDTGAFSYAGTNARTFGLAQELVELGADPVHIAQSVYFSSPTSKMRLLGAALSNLQREGSLAWMHVTRAQMEQTEAVDEDAEGIVNYALGIVGVEVAVFFRELEDGRYRVSLRSKGAIDVSQLAERFGGGGHHCASGFSIAGPLSVASQRILAELRTGPTEVAR